MGNMTKNQETAILNMCGGFKFLEEPDMRGMTYDEASDWIKESQLKIDEKISSWKKRKQYHV